MSKEEQMLTMWSLVFFAVLTGLLTASARMIDVGEQDKIQEVLEKHVRGAIVGPAPEQMQEQRRALTRMLAWISEMVERV